MDIALKTLVVIIFLLVPGFLFRRIFYQGPFSKQFDSKSWSHSLAYSIFFGLGLNALAYILFETVVSKIDIQQCIEFYSLMDDDAIAKISESQKSTNGTTKTLEIQKFNAKKILQYIGILYGISLILPEFLYLAIRDLKLYRLSELLMFNNHWYYYFNGRMKDIRNASELKGKCIAVNVDILTKSDSNGNNLYSGLLSYYTTDNSGKLETISLTETQIFDRKEDVKKFRDIHSNVFIIPYSDIININIRYTFDDEDTSAIDFIAVILCIIGIIYIIWDYNNHFNFNSEHTLMLKICAGILVISASLFIHTFLRICIYDASKIPTNDNASDEQKRKINITNLAKKDKLTKMQVDFRKSFYNTIFIIILLIVSYYLFLHIEK